MSTETNNNATPATPAVPLTSKAPAELASLFEEARGCYEPHVQTLSEGSHAEASVLLVPNGMRVVDVKPYLDKFRRFPERPTGTSEHQTLASIIDHANHYRTEATAAFAEIAPAAASLLVVYDYHLVTERARDADEAGARWCNFGSRYLFPLAPEFLAWREKSGKDLSQADMAAFLEDHLQEVCATDDAGERTTKLAETLGVTIASASSLLGFARRSAATVNLFVAEKRNTTTGAVELIYQEEVNHQTEDRASITPPGVFAILVPVLQGGTAYRLPVRLRAKVSGRSIKWSFEVYRIDNAFTLAVEEELARFTTETVNAIPVYRGRMLAK